MENNTAKNRFELPDQGGDVYAEYRMDGDTLYVNYVFAAPELRGSGAAGRLMQDIVDHAAAENLTVVPVCGYAASWMRRHQPKEGHPHA